MIHASAVAPVSPGTLADIYGTNLAAAPATTPGLPLGPSLGNVHLGFLSLPFLWPFVKSLKEKYRDSAEAVKEGVDRARNLDIHRYTKPIRKRWKARMN